LPHYDTPEYFLALSKDGADEIVDLSRAGFLQTAYASKFTQQSTTGVDIILDARGIRRCCDSFTGWSDPLVVIGFEAGGTPVVKANYLLLKNIGAQRTAGERLQDRSARAGKEIFSRRSFHSMNRVGSISADDHQSAGEVPGTHFHSLLSRGAAGEPTPPPHGA
jgi:hypothetical protein